jgi:hypothetical protein
MTCGLQPMTNTPMATFLVPNHSIMWCGQQQQL